MSRDIRSYFMTKDTTKSNNEAKLADKNNSKSKQLKKKKRMAIFDSDEDDEIKPPEGKRVKSSEQNSKQKVKRVPEAEASKLKPVDVNDIFGKDKIKRVSNVVAKNSPDDIKDEFSDVDFEATLDQIDEIESTYLKHVDLATPSKQKVPSSKKKSKSIKRKSSPSESNKSEIEITHNNANTPDIPEALPNVCKQNNSKATPKKKKKDFGESNGTLNVSSVCSQDSPSFKQNVVTGKLDMSDIKSPEEKKREHAQSYLRYLNREGPKHPGSKEIPEGKTGCLAGLTFVITGVLDSLEREEATALIQKYGGRVTASLSKNTSYIIIGTEPGPSKISKAETLKTSKLNEDGLLALIAKSNESKDLKKIEETVQEKSALPKTKSEKTPEIEKLSRKEKKGESSKNNKPETLGNMRDLETTLLNSKSLISERKLNSVLPNPEGADSSLWVDKYRPTCTKQIIGQQGDRSAVKKLTKWLLNWHKNNSGNSKHSKPSPWAKDDDGAYFKAALLSGPPGVGKTTTAHLVSKELNFDVVEFNASDTRSKRLLHEEITELLSTQSLYGYFHEKKGEKVSSKHILVMDEVDGMAGNEDRGGVQELIQLIKTTHIPIICMCNDRNHPKIRSLVNYCFDLRFPKPRVEQIKGAVMSICFKEGLKISADALSDVIISANQDVRQVLHHLSLWSAKEKVLASENIKHEAEKSKKEFKLGPWDVVKKVFSVEDHKNMTIHDKSDLFFYDYNISPLFVQENFLSAVPTVAKGDIKKTLELISETADSISVGDIVEKKIRSSNTWSLLSVQAIFSSVLPGEYMEGYLKNQINFPSWLGKNSRRNKFDRMLQDLHIHLRLNISGSKMSVNLDYLTHVRDRIINPLIKDGIEGVSKSIETMKNYCLLREDLDSLIELSLWPNQKDPWSLVDSKVKAALTRAYNKHGLLTPYSVVSSIKKKSVASSELIEDEDEVSDGVEDDDIISDGMIKLNKRTSSIKESKDSKQKSKKTDKTSKSAPSKGSRGRGKSR